MLRRLRLPAALPRTAPAAAPVYPPAFWMLFWGLFVNRASASLIWPFLTDYMHESLGIALTVTALLISLQSGMGLLSTALLSPRMDRVGRKGMMILGLAATSVVLVSMSLTGDFALWVLLVAAYGAVIQLFNVGSNAMVADLVQPEHRSRAYAQFRMIGNLGIAIGPALGGVLIANFSFQFSFIITAAINLGLALYLLLALPETMPQRPADIPAVPDGGFRVIFRDRTFVTVIGLFVLALSAPTTMFTLLLIYAKTHYGVAEESFSWIVTTNALMVVFLQTSITRFSARFPPVPVMAAGALLYALGIGSVGLGTAFPAFLLSMVVLTFGELLIAPTTTAFVANLAPADRRARYMGVFSITYPIAAGFAPVIGGFLGDTVAPQATWFGAMFMTLIAAGGFVWLARQKTFTQHFTAQVQATSAPPMRHRSDEDAHGI